MPGFGGGVEIRYWQMVSNADDLSCMFQGYETAMGASRNEGSYVGKIEPCLSYNHSTDLKLHRTV